MSKKTEKTKEDEQVEQTEQTDKVEKSEESEESVKDEQAEKTEKSKKSEKAGKSGKSDKAEKTEKAGKSEKSKKAEKEKKAGSSTVLTVVIVILAVLLVGAIGFICYMLFGDGLKEKKDPSYDKIVMKIGDYEVDYETYRYYFLTGMRSYDGGDLTYWSTSEGAETLARLQEDIREELTRQAAVRTLAAKYGITLSKEKEQEIRDAVEQVSLQVESAYGVPMATQLTQYNMTMDFYIENALYEELENETYTEITARDGGIVKYDSDAVGDYAKDFFHVKYILYGYNDSLTPEEAKAKAEETLEKLNAIEDQEERFAEFDALVQSDSNDYQADGNNFYYYRAGEMDDEFEAVANKLEENEISGVVETQFGYLVILRLPVDMAFFTEKVYPTYQFGEMVEACADTLTVTTTSFYDTITPETAK